MATLLESLKSDSRQERARATQTYRTLLARNDDPHDGDAEMLRAAMDTLGLGSADVEKDLAALAKATRARAGILPPERIEAMREAQRERADAADKAMREVLKSFVDRVERGWLEPALDRLVQDVRMVTADTNAIAEAREAFRRGVSDGALVSATAVSSQAEKELAAIEQNNPRLF